MAKTFTGSDQSLDDDVSNETLDRQPGFWIKRKRPICVKENAVYYVAEVCACRRLNWVIDRRTFRLIPQVFAGSREQLSRLISKAYGNGIDRCPMCGRPKPGDAVDYCYIPPVKTDETD